MHERVVWLPGNLVGTDELEQEFEARLADSAALTIRVAYSVLRNQHDAEDVAQEAFARAHRAFAGIRDRSQFRSWIVRTSWRVGDRPLSAAARKIAPPSVFD